MDARDKTAIKRMAIASIFWMAGVCLVAAWAFDIDVRLGIGIGLMLTVIGLRVCWG